MQVIRTITGVIPVDEPAQFTTLANYSGLAKKELYYITDYSDSVKTTPADVVNDINAYIGNNRCS